MQQTDFRNCLKAVCFATAHTALQCNSECPVLPKCLLSVLGLWHEELCARPDADTCPSYPSSVFFFSKLAIMVDSNRRIN